MTNLLKLLAGLASYVVASVVAAVLVLASMLAQDVVRSGWSSLSTAFTTDFVSFLPAAALIVMVYALLPFLAAIALLHVVKRTGWLAHAVAGAAVSLVAQIIMAPGLMMRPGEVVESWPMLLGGAVAGATYWLVLGALLPLTRRRVAA